MNEGDQILYFAYGSNMSTPRLQSRVPSARPLGLARLEGHCLRFHKFSTTGSGKCDIEHTGADGDRVYGVVFEMQSEEKCLLDSCEGLGKGYDVRTVSVQLDSGLIEAFSYVATRVAPGLKPFSWYLQHVLRGAREHSLPLDYIERIATQESIVDPDSANHERELSIYGRGR